MIRFIQQSARDLMLRLAPEDCVDLHAALVQIERGHSATLTLEVHASIFHIRSPKEVELDLRPAGVDRIHREVRGNVPLLRTARDDSRSNAHCF
ncbi:MAG TPA: hypothetical protein VJU61_27735 [Polyangiaceae bacterium]|nr:hypothetical protein [Polyangiaceae bacterium]